jgi:hypothetical protein
MTASTTYFPYEHKMLSPRWNKRRKSTSLGPQFATRLVREALSFAVLLPRMRPHSRGKYTKSR